MIILIVAIFTCEYSGVLSAQQCTDWQGKSVADGIDFYPSKSDPCLMCRCDKGLKTMCQSVSCQPPDCPEGKPIAGKCCQFECFGGDMGNMDNGTGIVKRGNNAGTKPDIAMTDLGFRLVASTVSTFIILALLLFLIHRFRQRRLQLAFRRYNRRRQRLDDSENMDFSPAFLEIQCPPPYVDPPPPYSPPKPAPEEQPPPYDAVNSDIATVNNNNDARGRNIQALWNTFSVNFSSRNNNSNSEGNGNTMVTCDGRTNNPHNNTHRNATFGSSRNNSADGRRSDFVGPRIHERNLSGHDSLLNACCSTNTNTPRVHASGQQHVTMGIQNQTEINRNQFFSDSFSPMRNLHNTSAISNATNALNLELRSTILNFRNRNHNRQSSTCLSDDIEANLSSSTTDIGESTTSTESSASCPESPDYESDAARNMEDATHVLSDDAESTVKQFLDRQFGPFAKNRRSPTTISQLVMHAQMPSAAVESNVRQSISLGSFPDKADNQNTQMPACSVADRTLAGLPLPRSKSDHLKTNQSLLNEPYKGIIKSSTSFLPSATCAARVCYKEYDDVKDLNFQRNEASENDYSNFELTVSEIENSADLNISECSSSIDQHRLSAQTFLLDPGEIIVSRLQDELRTLRLSHLFKKPLLDLAANGHSNSSCSASHHHLHGSLSGNSLASSVSMCSNMDEKSSVSVIDNDIQDSDNTLKQSLNSCLLNKQCTNNEANSFLLNNLQQMICTQSFEREVNCGNGKNNNSDLFETSNESRKVLCQALPEVSMVQSRHTSQNRFCDENAQIGCANTFVEKVNGNIEMRSILGKDVPNVFFPSHELSNADVIIDRNVVPSSEKRACASQLYNYDTEEKVKKKKTKRHLFKRNSASCFQVKHENHALQADSLHSTGRAVSSRANNLGNKMNELSCERKSCKISGDRFNKDTLVAELNLLPLFNCHSASYSHVQDVSECLNTHRADTLGKNEKKRCESVERRDFVMSVGRKESSNSSSQLKKKKFDIGTEVPLSSHNNILEPQDSPPSVHKHHYFSKGENRLCAVTNI